MTEMTDAELDQLLNCWRIPPAPLSMRARVLADFPSRAPRALSRPLRWGLAIAVASGVLAVAMEQSGHGAMETLASGVSHLSTGLSGWLDEHWCGHIMAAFLGSNPKVYVDGELQPDSAYGGSGATLWLRTPGEGKYYLALRREVYEGRSTPQPAGRFDGRVLEFQLGGHAVRIESRHNYGFGHVRPVYAWGPVAGR